MRVLVRVWISGTFWKPYTVDFVAKGDYNLLLIGRQVDKPAQSIV